LKECKAIIWYLEVASNVNPLTSFFFNNFDERS